MNNVKSLIQKEEYISLAINKYILQTGTIPKKSDDTLDWEKLEVEDYLGTKFNKINPVTNKEIIITFDEKNSAFIKGAIEKEADYKEEYNYLYNFYTNKVFRVNTIPPKDITKTELSKGTQVLYNSVQKEIISVINKYNNPSNEECKQKNDRIFLPTQNCNTGKCFYELSNEKLTYKYCKENGTTLEVFQSSPIYLEEGNDLKHIKAEIGATAFVKKNGEWFEYYYQGNTDEPWIPVGAGEKLSSEQQEESQYIEKISSYIPNAKDLFIRQSGGCMLANGDIFCWGNNDFKKAGISSYGQIDTSLSPDYVNTPVMLKTQIDDIKIGSTTYDLKSKKWYNNPYRVKFDKMAMNRSNVCGITKIFEYTQDGINYKFGGDLYCNGNISSTYYEDLNSTAVESNILKRNKAVYTGKSNIKNSSSIYLKDIAMIEDVTALLSDDGKIYVIGKNYKGSLGINSSDNFYFVFTPTLVSANSNIVFEKIFALRDSRTFGAIDSNKIFYIWGERGNNVITKPTPIESSKQFNPDGIFVNTNEFVLKGMDGIYYKTKGNTEIEAITSSIEGTPISLSYFKDNKNSEYLLYIDENLTLKGTSSLLSCRESNETSTCDLNSNKIFNTSLTYLNSPNNEISNKLANFTNVSIFKLDHQISEIYEDFEDDLVDWNTENTYNGGEQATTFLGRFAYEWGSDKADYVNKTFDFGSSNANKAITIKLDFYEIDSWNDEFFRVHANGDLVHDKSYAHGRNDGGTPLKMSRPSGWGDEEKHHIVINTTLDSNGKVKLSFSSTLNGAVITESWGVDNIEIYRSSDNKLLERNDFEPISGWSSTTVTAVPDNGDTTQVPATTFLGYFPTSKSNGEPFFITKTYSFPGYGNYEVDIEFDFYEIDTWDGERFEFYANNELLAQDNFVQAALAGFPDSNITGVDLQDNVGNTSRTEAVFKGDQKYTYKLRTKLDAKGEVILRFQSNLEFVKRTYDIWGKNPEGIDNESWGIDNIKVKLRETNKKFVCAMTGVEDASQMYCWGNVARSIPILSTSLYDMSRINTINKLFISQDGEKSNQMSFDEYFNDGKLFLKYPTYIGGFDYPFYFR